MKNGGIMEAQNRLCEKMKILCQTKLISELKLRHPMHWYKMHMSTDKLNIIGDIKEKNRSAKAHKTCHTWWLKTQMSTYVHTWTHMHIYEFTHMLKHTVQI